ncbi:Helix-turn-helix domain-containing protein [Flagellimonas zhangzhouensis]|uniref:Helix-turn-helix domain-containing protein n=2 Tax=Flagellimonas zhangzhouensis TaxID=1073328 RepID=A0A1H2VPM7_9FLAO|nr:Helix-turn-helix domain-containing protein [Allomuricauda zhangzhouensis]SDW70208.1 Helix-turn-helix domain-containing protein [Allomuricauda zhangzhouensis]
MSIWNQTPFFTKKNGQTITKNLLFIFFFLFVYSVGILSFSWFKSDGQINTVLVFSHLIPLLLYAVIIFVLIRFPKILDQSVYHLGTLQMKQNKYEKTGLSESFSLELKDKLENLMDSKKLYLNHEIRLNHIADLLDISRHHASQVINENFGLSFYDFINSYRIKDAKIKLCNGFENSSESISDIAYQCGFNNRVSFYKAFKKVTGSTPTEFMVKAA